MAGKSATKKTTGKASTKAAKTVKEEKVTEAASVAAEVKKEEAAPVVEEVNVAKTKAKSTRKSKSTPVAKASPAAEVKEEVKEAAPVAEVKEEVKEAAPVVEVKEEVKSAASIDVYVEFNGVQEAIADVVENVKKTYVASGYTDEITSVKVYLKPAENTAYYVVNETVEGSMGVYF